MSIMGKMSFFLGLQLSQSARGIFLNQSKYAFKIIKKYGLLTSDSVDIPMVEKNKMDEDLQGTPVDATLYRAYSDVDYAGYLDTRRSTSGSAQFRNMNPVAAKQVALNTDLVALDKRLKIEKCNARIEFSKPQREETYQVTLDAVKLNPCYHAFLITAEEVKKVASPSRKLSPVLEEELVEKPKRAKKPAKKSTSVLTTGVVIRDTPSKSVPKNKTPAKVVRGKGMYLQSDVALLKAIQLKKTLKKSKLETHKLHKVAQVMELVPNQSEDDDRNDDENDEVTKDDDKDDVDSDADGDKEASDSEKTDSNKYENPNLNQNDAEEEEYEKEYVRTPDSFEFIEDDEKYEELYKDVNVRLKETWHEKEGKRDEEMIDVGRDDGTQQTTYEQVKDDEHVILTTVHDTQKTKVPLQSLSVSSDFANQFLNLDNVLPTDIEVVSMMNVKVHHEEPNAQLSTRLEDSIKKFFRSYTTEFKKKAKDGRKRYIDLVEKSVKDIIKDEVKS
nr:uncharacterized mitochondrial protein AtMg00810-like [Tanacetum cinerariifolium]